MTYFGNNPKTGAVLEFAFLHNAEMYARAKMGKVWRVSKKGNKIILNDYSKQLRETLAI